jgi:hypothetical protein
MDQTTAELTTQWRSWIGRRVVKRSSKPFKSKLKVATVKDVVPHPQRPRHFAFSFVEDESIVACEMLTLEKAMLPLGHGYEVEVLKSHEKGWYGQVYLNGILAYETPGGTVSHGDTVMAARMMMFDRLEQTDGKEETQKEAGSQAQE